MEKVWYSKGISQEEFPLEKILGLIEEQLGYKNPIVRDIRVGKNKILYYLTDETLGCWHNQELFM